ncbi:MAG: SRPBCC family protein [Gemmatimonadaceae bacterium]
MPIRKDDSGKRWVEMEFITPGTPEQVWKAMATGPGNTAWFTTTTIDERVGGVIRFDFGPDGGSTGEVTTWEPPFRFGYVEREWMEGAPPVATEITITGRSGDQCVVRMVHSLFASSDSWDDQLEGFEAGWPGFFEVLRVYLAHFPGHPAASVKMSASHSGGELEAWSVMTRALNLGGANVGERRQAPPGAPRLAGVVEHVHQDRRARFLIVRTDQPNGIALLGAYMAGPEARGSIVLYLYGEDAADRADAARTEWRDWLRDRFNGGGPPAAT